MSRLHVRDDVRPDDGDPNTRARLRKERAIRIVDLITYAVVFLSGLMVLIQVPLSVRHLLDPEVVLTWAILLMVSGGTGFVGRLSRLWAIEAPGAFAGAFGAAVYFIILAGASFNGQVTGLVAATFVGCMSLLMVRRYIELQLFTTDPGDVSLAARIRLALLRRTKDAITSGLK